MGNVAMSSKEAAAARAAAGAANCSQTIRATCAPIKCMVTLHDADQYPVWFENRLSTADYYAIIGELRQILENLNSVHRQTFSRHALIGGISTCVLSVSFMFGFIFTFVGFGIGNAPMMYFGLVNVAFFIGSFVSLAYSETARQQARNEFWQESCTKARMRCGQLCAEYSNLDVSCVSSMDVVVSPEMIIVIRVMGPPGSRVVRVNGANNGGGGGDVAAGIAMGQAMDDDDGTTNASVAVSIVSGAAVVAGGEGGDKSAVAALPYHDAGGGVAGGGGADAPPAYADESDDSDVHKPVQ